MRTRVVRTFDFEAAHVLPWHPGKCSRLHGHTYRLEVTVEGPIGDDGMVMDFGDLKEVVETEIVSQWDHRYLNDFFENPTAEVLAVEAWKRLEARALELVRLRLWETPRACVEIER
jgi:6-pyruvoyltetrahydropterin/6-carboxytetrahydropterin synthase